MTTLVYKPLTDRLADAASRVEGGIDVRVALAHEGISTAADFKELRQQLHDEIAATCPVLHGVAQLMLVASQAGQSSALLESVIEVSERVAGETGSLRGDQAALDGRVGRVEADQQRLVGAFEELEERVNSRRWLRGS